MDQAPLTIAIFGASGGIGGALAHELAAHRLFLFSRSGGDFSFDDEATIARLSKECPTDLDMILITTGGLALNDVPPEKTIAKLDPVNMASHMQVNAIGPALIMKHFHGHLSKSRRSVMAALSARVGSIEDNRLGGWVSYRAAKAALNQIVRTASIEIARKRPNAIVVALHPGTVETNLTRDFAAQHLTVTADIAARNIISVLGGLAPEDSGGFFDWAGKKVPW